LGGWNYHESHLCGSPLVYGQVVYGLVIFLGDCFVVGDCKLWIDSGSSNSRFSKYCRLEVWDSEISPKIPLRLKFGGKSIARLDFLE